MIGKTHRAAIIGIILTAGFLVEPVYAAGGVFGDLSAKAISDDTVTKIQVALAEQRYLDASRMLNEALLSAGDDPRLLLLSGELNLSRARYSDALTNFKSVEGNANVRADAFQGSGIALSLLGRSNEAMIALQVAVTENPTAWRAWNAIATEFDRRRDWTQAEAAYDHALSNSDAAAAVLNNRGFSRLLQNRIDEAVADFIAALEKKPDLAPARTNLRLAIAMKGDYSRAASSSGHDDRAVLLNNAGFAAMLRGDYAQAETLLDQAMKAKGVYYARASANLEMNQSLEMRDANASDTAHVVGH